MVQKVHNLLIPLGLGDFSCLSTLANGLFTFYSHFSCLKKAKKRKKHFFSSKFGFIP